MFWKSLPGVGSEDFPVTIITIEKAGNSGISYRMQFDASDYFTAKHLIQENFDGSSELEAIDRFEYLLGVISGLWESNDSAFSQLPAFRQGYADASSALQQLQGLHTSGTFDIEDFQEHLELLAGRVTTRSMERFEKEAFDWYKTRSALAVGALIFIFIFRMPAVISIVVAELVYYVLIKEKADYILPIGAQALVLSGLCFLLDNISFGG